MATPSAGGGGDLSSVLQTVVTAMQNVTQNINSLSSGLRKTFANIKPSILLGNPAASDAGLQAITLGDTLAFVGTELQTIALTGVVTTSANSFETSLSLDPGSITTGDLADGAVTTPKLAANAVTFAKMQAIASQTILGNNTGSSAVPSALTGSQVQVLAAVVPGTNVEILGEATAINTQTASYTLTLSDIGKIIEMNVSSANSLTIPLNSAVAFPVDTIFPAIVQTGAGKTTFVAASGVTILSLGGNLSLAAQYAGATLYKRATDTWVLIGNLAA